MWILLLLQWAHSAPVLVKAPQADIYAYQVFVENSDNIRPSEIEHPCQERHDLAQNYHSSNDHFLNGSMEEAKNGFLQIATLQWSCDWKPKEREMIFESLLRLSQILVPEHERQKWMQTAAEFDPQLSPNTSLFAPPFVKNYSDIKNSIKSQTLHLGKYYDTYVKVYRNGRPFAISNKSIKVPSSQGRFTFVSDSHNPKTFMIHARDLHKQTITSTPYIDGDCKSFRFQKPTAWPQETRLFFSPECIVESATPSLLAENLNVPQHGNSIEQQLHADQSPRSPTWIERNYLWVGAALVGAVLISAEMNNRKQTQTVITPTNSANTK